jgi:hypothetical protein
VSRPSLLDLADEEGVDIDSLLCILDKPMVDPAHIDDDLVSIILLW